MNDSGSEGYELPGTVRLREYGGKTTDHRGKGLSSNWSRALARARREEWHTKS